MQRENYYFMVDWWVWDGMGSDEQEGEKVRKDVWRGKEGKEKDVYCCDKNGSEGWVKEGEGI